MLEMGSSPYGLLKERGIPSTLSNPEIKAANAFDLRMQGERDSGISKGSGDNVLGGRFADVDATRGADEVGHHVDQNRYN